LPSRSAESKSQEEKKKTLMIEQAGSFVKGVSHEFSPRGMFRQHPLPFHTTRNKVVDVLRLAWTGRTGWEMGEKNSPRETILLVTGWLIV
jgi:hypothetical protein